MRALVIAHSPPNARGQSGRVSDGLRGRSLARIATASASIGGWMDGGRVASRWLLYANGRLLPPIAACSEGLRFTLHDQSPSHSSWLAASTGYKRIARER